MMLRIWQAFLTFKQLFAIWEANDFPPESRPKRVLPIKVTVHLGLIQSSAIAFF
jgi:hypothetical protein